MKTSYILCVLMVLPLLTFAQRSPQESEIFISGFGKEIRGNHIQYSSGVENINEALITRANTGKQDIEWETGNISISKGIKKVTFVHYIGYDHRGTNSIFNFFINGKKEGEISVPESSGDSWSLSFGTKELTFEKNFTDSNRDIFGFLYLTVPASEVKNSKTLTLKITGAKESKLVWFMVFRKNITESIELESLPAVINNNGEKFGLALLKVTYLNQPIQTKISVNGSLYKEVTLKTGIQNIEIQYPVKTKSLKVEVSNKYFQKKASIKIEEFRDWKVNFVQHSHTDIGYTRSQVEILSEHLRYIDYALDYCDATDNYPEDSKFRWTCEASWAVDEYIKVRPKSQIDRLKKRISEGRIEVTGMYFNFNELPDEPSLAASLLPLKKITEQGIPVVSAMQNDVNGIGWCMNDYFNSLNIRYLNMGTHGHKALIAFDTPLAFWWVSPSGKRVLAFRAEHYMIGNTAFGIHLDDFENFERSVLRYLNKIKDRGYPYDQIAIQHSGFLTDNSPPSLKASVMIKKWNEKYEWPKLKTSVVKEFFEDIEKKYGDDLQEIKAHWPDWWTDGFASGAREVAASRDAHTSLIAGEGGLALAKLLGSEMPDGVTDRIFETNKALLFYGEHTFGAAESISDPYGKSSMEQREIKESYAWEANRRAKMINEEALGLLNQYVGTEDKNSIVVYNTLNWERDGLITLFIDHQQVPDGMALRMTDLDGNVIKTQNVKPWHGGSYWSAWVPKISSLGYKKFVFEAYDPMKKHIEDHSGQQNHQHIISNDYANSDEIIIENSWYKIKIDKSTGTIKTIKDFELGIEIIDSLSQYNLGEFILEKLGGREQLQANTQPNGSRYGHLNDYSRHPLDSIKLTEIKEGEIWNTIRFAGFTETALDVKEPYSFEIRLFNTTKRIDLAFELMKKPITDPESFYIAFPFQLENGIIDIEIAGGPMEAGIEQIPGSANDWNTVQNFINVRNSKHQIILVSPEAPIVQLGNINTGRFEYGASPESTHIFSWPMNNYWTTNYNADQRGMFTWSYNLTSLTSSDDIEATHFGWGTRVPFLARVVPKSLNPIPKKSSLSLMQSIPDNILLVSIQPSQDENSVLLHFREIGNRMAEFNPELFEKRPWQWTEVNVVGEEIKKVDALAIAPLESKFYKLSW